MDEGDAHRFRVGHTEEWGALEVEAGPYGKERAKRALVVTPDPEELLDLVATGIKRGGDARMAYISPSHQYPLGAATMT